MAVNEFLLYMVGTKSVNEMKKMLIDLKLLPIVLEEQTNEGLTLIDKLETYSDVSYIFVLFTPEDYGLINNAPSSTVIEERVRQNVMLEYGYFLGKLGRNRICLLYQGDPEIPSDIHGIAYYRFNNSIYERINEIKRELQKAGLIT